MLIEPTEKSWGPDYLRFGLALASDFAGDNQFNVRVQYRRTWLNRLGAEWVSEAQIGQHAFFSTEWYQPLNEAGQLVRRARRSTRACGRAACSSTRTRWRTTGPP